MNLHSLQAGRIDFIPYQYRPVLKFIRTDRPRSSCSRTKSAWATQARPSRPVSSSGNSRLAGRSETSSSSARRRSWSRRSGRARSRRFDEEFVVLDGKTLRYCLDQTDLDGEWPDRYGRAILVSSLVQCRRCFSGRLACHVAAYGEGSTRPRRAAALRPSDRR